MIFLMVLLSLLNVGYTSNETNTDVCIQYSTWCQNRGCICISLARRTYRFESILHISRFQVLQDRIFQGRGEERFQYYFSVFKFYKSFNLNTVFPHAILNKFSVILHRINSSTRITSRSTSNTRFISCIETILHTRDFPVTAPRGSKHSTQQQFFHSTLQGFPGFQ